MGFTPKEVGEMSLWEFSCCASAFMKKDQGEGQELSDDDMRALGIAGF